MFQKCWNFKFFKFSYFCFPNFYVCEYLSKPFVLITTVKGVTTIEGIKTMFCLSSILIIFRKFFHQLWIKKFKNDWTKRFQKIPRKINVSLSLAKRKLAEKNEWDLFNQSGEVTHAFINLTNCRKSLFFQLPYLEHDFMITNLVRLNLIFWKYWRRPRNILGLC